MLLLFFFFFFNDTATTEIYTLSLHDALPISLWLRCQQQEAGCQPACRLPACPTIVYGFAIPSFAYQGLADLIAAFTARSEEHTSELQSRLHLVCRLLLEKKKIITISPANCAD